MKQTRLKCASHAKMVKTEPKMSQAYTALPVGLKESAITLLHVRRGGPFVIGNAKAKNPYSQIPLHS